MSGTEDNVIFFGIMGGIFLFGICTFLVCIPLYRRYNSTPVRPFNYYNNNRYGIENC
jgi:hypothetical protein